MKFFRSLTTQLLVVLFLSGGTVLFFVALELRGHQGELFLYRGAQVLDHLYRTQLEEGQSTGLPEGVRGFGIYDEAGRLTQGEGEVPPRIDPRVLALDGGLDPQPIIRMGANEYAIIRPLLRAMRGLPMDQGPRMRPMRRPPEMELPRGFLYLRIHDTTIGSRELFWSVLMVLGPLMWGVLMALAGVLLGRNKRYQEALNHNRELLQYAEAGRTLSHEIKNPLASIVLQTAIVRRDYQNRGLEVPEELQLIETETQRIAKLMVKVRDYLKDPGGQPTVLGLWQEVHEVCMRLAPQTILEPSQDPGLSIVFDRDRLRSVLENLVQNALEAQAGQGLVPGQAQALTIRLGKSKGRFHMLEILDQGPGFSPEILQKAFTPFFTTKPQGSGIGLALARSFVEAAGGSIRLGNNPQGGGLVTLELLGTKP